jgi:hypothetical protein
MASRAFYAIINDTRTCLFLFSTRKYIAAEYEVALSSQNTYSCILLSLSSFISIYQYIEIINLLIKQTLMLILANPEPN